jgi:hypothetical protein
MKLAIDDNKTILELQNAFSKCFPLLKIEFYKKAHRWEQASSIEHLISVDKKIGEIRKKHHPGTLEIKRCYETGRVEQDFKKLFDLNVQIFRNENNGWIQSSSTDKFTLEQQSEMARKATFSIFPCHKEQLREYEC